MGHNPHQGMKTIIGEGSDGYGKQRDLQIRSVFSRSDIIIFFLYPSYPWFPRGVSDESTIFCLSELSYLHLFVADQNLNVMALVEQNGLKADEGYVEVKIACKDCCNEYHTSDNNTASGTL